MEKVNFLREIDFFWCAVHGIYLVGESPIHA